METLIKRFDYWINTWDEANYTGESEDRDAVPSKCAEECKQVAIEFAKYYLSGIIKKHHRGSIGDEGKVEEYRTPEMDVLLGELIKNGSDNFNKFLKKYGK